MNQAEIIRTALQRTAELDRLWLGKIQEASSSRSTPWMPFPVPEFIAMLAEAVAAADGDKLLEIGCGIGTRMLLADVIFCLNTQGIEVVPEYVTQARQLGLLVHEADAASWKGYGDYDIIWFNRPFRDRILQADLECTVWDETRPGAVVMCANLENKPPSSWLIVDDDWEVRRGVWQKPPGSTT